MPQALLEGQLTHAFLPHGCRVCMAKRVRRDPGFANTEPFTVAFKELDERVITKRFTSSFSLTTHEENKRTCGLFRTFSHDIRIECLERFWFQEINHSLGS